jgi:hypothetical protein
MRAALAGKNGDDLAAFLREIVSRWCDQDGNVQDCARFITALSNLNVTAVACAAADLAGVTADGCFDVNINFPDVPEDAPGTNPNPNPDQGTTQGLTQILFGRFHETAATVEAAVDASLTNGDSGSGLSSGEASSNGAAYVAPSIFVVVLAAVTAGLF